MPSTPEPVTREPPPLGARVISTQSWRDLTFLHWAVDPDEVAPLLPPGTRPDVFEGRTYVGLVPFRMVGVTVGRRPRVPYFGTFLETNVRLYSVDETGRRGVVFLSLDTDRAAAVPAIRAVIGAPYRWARMRFRRAGNRVTYEARLRRLGERPASRVVVRVGQPREATPARRLPDRPLGRPRAPARPDDLRPQPARAVAAARTRRCWSSTTSWSARSGCRV